MKFGFVVAVSGIVLLAATSARPQPGAPAPVLGSLQVKDISLIEIDTAHVRVAVNLNVVPGQSATLKDLRLCSLRLNGLPVFAAPLDQEIVLHKDVSIALPTLYVTALFRDLSTVEPLRRMIENQNVHLQGELLAGVHLSLIEKMALHTQHPEVVIPLSQDVPAQVAGSPFERTLALGVLSLIDAGLDAKAKAGNQLPGFKPDWIRDLEAQAKTNVFEVESSYSLTQGDQTYPVLSDGLGFRVKSAGIVTTAEALEPWKYDVEFLGAIKSGGAKLVKKSPDIQLRPIGSDGASLKLSVKDFTAESRGNPEDNPMTAVSTSYGQVQVLRRASPSALALLSPRGQPAQAGLAVASAAVTAQESWEQVAVFRLRLDPETKKAQSVEILQLGARRDGKSIVLSEPVDSAVFGSPIVTPDGVIGLVQDEQAGTFLPADVVLAARVPADAQ
ncbi:MAG: hypothetical protein ABR987_22470 [Terracidiphilus sp.]|jgi:hypothetical protein